MPEPYCAKGELVLVVEACCHQFWLLGKVIWDSVEAEV
jgi:hypothetical protein